MKLSTQKASVLVSFMYAFLIFAYTQGEKLNQSGAACGITTEVIEKLVSCSGGIPKNLTCATSDVILRFTRGAQNATAHFN